MVRLSPDEFRMMTVDEFDSVCEAFREYREAELHDGWERMRMHASICVQPHVRKRISAKDLIRFSWDNKEKSKKPIPSKEEAMKQYHELMARINKKENG